MVKKRRIKKVKTFDISPENINPKESETRFGALVPWGGGGPGGFDGILVGEEDDDDEERDD